MPIVPRFFAALASTSVARARRGPLQPGWSFLFETSIAFLRATARAATGRPPLEQRAVWDELRTPPSPVMKQVRRQPTRAGDVGAEWFRPVEVRSDAVVVYIHGGAFIYGSMASHGELVARLAVASGARVLAVDYRRAPEAKFPAAIDDVITACRWLRDQGVPPSKTVLAGDSAGGNLAITSLLAMRDRGEPRPAGSIAICPWVDMTWSGGSYDTNAEIDWALTADIPGWAAAYAGEADLRQPLLSPVNADLAGLPPLCVLWGEREMLRDQIAGFAAKAKAAGVDVSAREFPAMVHNWMTLHAFTEEAQRAFDEMGAFVERVAR